MSHAAAKARFVSLVEAITPTLRPGQKFRHRYRGTARTGGKAHAVRPNAVIRSGFEYRTTQRTRSEFISASPYLWREEGYLEVPYPVRGDFADLDTLDDLIASDEAQIREAIASGYTNAPKVMEHCIWDGPSETFDEYDDEGALQRRVNRIQLVNEHYA